MQKTCSEEIEIERADVRCLVRVKRGECLSCLVEALPVCIRNFGQAMKRVMKQGLRNVDEK